MKIVKIRLCNKIDDDFLRDILAVCIESEIFESFNLDLILEDFVSLRPRKMQF